MYCPRDMGPCAAFQASQCCMWKTEENWIVTTSQIRLFPRAFWRGSLTLRSIKSCCKIIMKKALLGYSYHVQLPVQKLLFIWWGVPSHPNCWARNAVLFVWSSHLALSDLLSAFHRTSRFWVKSEVPVFPHTYSPWSRWTGLFTLHIKPQQLTLLFNSRR